MSSKTRRIAAALISTAALGTTIGITATPASARASATVEEYCAIVSDPGTGIDFEGLSPQEADYAATLMRKAAKTGVPAKLKRDLKKLAKIYDQISNGADPADVATEKQSFILKAFTRFGKYTAAHCVGTPPGA